MNNTLPPTLDILTCTNSGTATCGCGSSSTTDLTKPAASGVLSVLLSIAVAFFPKCPLCWASYMSLFGIASLESIPYSPWMKPVIVVALSINLFVLYRIARAKSFYLAFFFSCAGATLILLASHTGVTSLATQGFALTIAGAVFNALPVKRVTARLRLWDGFAA